MTLHISAIVAGAAYQVSDRLATSGRQPWDRTWNKTIVLRTMDALVTVGLTFKWGRSGSPARAPKAVS